LITIFGAGRKVHAANPSSCGALVRSVKTDLNFLLRLFSDLPYADLPEQKIKFLPLYSAFAATTSG
jgi:hypothetical protein